VDAPERLNEAASLPCNQAWGVKKPNSGIQFSSKMPTGGPQAPEPTEVFASAGDRVAAKRLLEFLPA
jgi:hypothetical protein